MIHIHTDAVRLNWYRTSDSHKWSVTCSELFTFAWGVSFVQSNDPNAMIESKALKRINIIQFTRSTFKFYARNRIPKYIEKRPLAMLRSKIIYSPKDCVQCDRNNEDNLKNSPPESSGVTGNCNPWEETWPLIKILNKSIANRNVQIDSTRNNSRIEMAAQIENMIGNKKISIKFSILHLGPFSFPRHCMLRPKFSWTDPQWYQQ